MFWNLWPIVALAKTFYSFNRIFANMGALHCANYAKINKSLEKNCRSYKMYWKLRFICLIVVFWRNLDLYAHILCNVCANTPGQSWKHFQYEVWGRRRLGGDDLDTVSGLLKAPVSRTKTAVVVIVWFDHYYYNKPQSFIRLLNPPHLTQNPSYWWPIALFHFKKK